MEAALDTRCPVCLDNWDSAAYAMPCCHQFCFPCIQRWTSTRPQCPLCKQGVQSIIHTTPADSKYEELVLRPAPVASVATRRPAGPRAAWPWPAVPRRSAGGLSRDTWASIFRENPALLRPLRSWLQRKLRRILGTEEPQAEALANSVISALLLVGLEQDILMERLDLHLHGHTGNFVRQFIAFTVQKYGREAQRLLGLNVTPAAGAQEVTVEQAVPHEEPGQPVAGPSGHSLPQQSRRALKRKASDCQASASPKKRPASRQQ